MTDLEALLAECRKNPDDKPAKFALLDRLQDDDGFVKAVSVAVSWMTCERCGVPDSDEPMHDIHGQWYRNSEVVNMNQDVGANLFALIDDADWEIRYDATLAFYRTDRWWLVCPACRRSLVAAKAHATRKARADAARAAEPNLFGGIE